MSESEPPIVANNYCYVLVDSTTRFTYAGYTVNPIKRLRQHNGEIKGGARATSRRVNATFDSWSFAFVVTSPAFTKKVALSFEWHLKQHRGARTPGNPVDRRIAFLVHSLGNPKFANCLSAGVKIYVAPAYMAQVEAALLLEPFCGATATVDSLEKVMETHLSFSIL
jgi:predicted GIY-YIG superfamily endonuclease